MFRPLATAVPLALAALAVACSSDGGDRRVIDIVQTDDGCTPASIDLVTGEKVTFRVDNQASKDWEVEGIDGTKVEEVLVPSGRSRNVGFTAPGDPGTGKIKCYVPGGNSTVIDLLIADGGSGGDEPGGETDDEEGGTSAYLTTATPGDTVNVDLFEYTVSPDSPSVAAGPVKFVASNTSETQVHELAVLRVKDDGDFETTGEIEDLDPGTSGEIVLDLPPGEYVLACLIVPGEAGSEVDHYEQGMHTAFTVN